MSDLETPSDELADLYAAERAAPTVDAGRRAAARSRLAAAVGRAPLGHAAAGTSAFGGAAKALATIAIIAGAGAGAMAIAKHVASAPAARAASTVPVRVEPSPPPPLVQPVVQVDEPPPAAPVEQLAMPSTPAPVKHLAAPVAETTSSPAVDRAVESAAASSPSEPELLQRAWTALSAGQAELARQLADQDAQLHPDGALGEERDAVEILALAKLARMDAARAAAARFIQRYPNSVHRARVERTLASQEMP